MDFYRAHFLLDDVHWILLVAFVALFGMQLGGGGEAHDLGSCLLQAPHVRSAGPSFGKCQRHPWPL